MLRVLADRRGTDHGFTSNGSWLRHGFDALDVEPGHRVLELGAGTCWNAALIAHRVGPAGHVTSVEAAPDLAAGARAASTRRSRSSSVTAPRATATAPHTTA